MNTMKILIIDGQNFLHRARSGFQLGEFNIVYNFFRSLKPLIEQFKPNRVYFTREGHPKKRYELLPEYKANRIIDQTTSEGKDKHKSLEDFHRQADVIVDMLSRHFPVSVVRHVDFEADDVIWNLINNSSRATEFTVVSTDSDFVQLLQEFNNVKLYNPISKSFVEPPDYDYVTWKALRGDSSDNVPTIVTESAALSLVNDVELLENFFKDDEMRKLFHRNYVLIQLARWNEEEALQMTSSSPVRNWEAIHNQFNEMTFKSMTKDTYWEKFKATFDSLWGN